MIRAVVLALLVLLYNTSAKAVIRINIDFTSDVTYRDTIAAARAAIGEPFTNIQTQIEGEPVRRIYRTPDTGRRQRVIASVTGLDLQPNVNRIEFLMETNSLYIIGFLITDPNVAGAGHAFEFPDIPDGMGPIPGAGQTTVLANDSNYNRLTRVAGITREELAFSRPSLTASYLALGAHQGGALTGVSAAAILRFATVISEAMRFGSIERLFAMNVLRDFQDWRMPTPAIQMTLNWQNLSADIHAINESGNAVTEETEARAGMVRAKGPRALTLAASMVKFCDGVLTRQELRRRRSTWAYYFGSESVVPVPANLNECPKVKRLVDDVYVDEPDFIREIAM